MKFKDSLITPQVLSHQDVWNCGGIYVSSPWRMGNNGNMGKPKAACITNPSMKALFCASKTMGYLQNPPNRMKYATVIGKRMINHDKHHDKHHDKPGVSMGIPFSAVDWISGSCTSIFSGLCWTAICACVASSPLNHGGKPNVENLTATIALKMFSNFWKYRKKLGKYRKMEFWTMELLATRLSDKAKYLPNFVAS